MNRLGLMPRTLLVLVGLFAASSSVLAVYLAWNIDSNLTAQYREQGRVIAENLAVSSGEAILHQDPATVQAMLDERKNGSQGVAYLLVVDSHGEPLCHTFVPSLPQELKDYHEQPHRTVISNIRLPVMGDVIDICTPILAGRGGYVHVGMDRRPIRAAVWASVRQTIGILSALFVFSTLLCRILLGKLIRPLRSLTHSARRFAARKPTEDQNDTTLPDWFPSATGHDEVSQLTRAFRSMAQEVINNVHELEAKVASRTSELTARNNDMRMLLDSLGQGFFTIDARGVISSERSAVVESWLGPISPEMTFAELVRAHDAAFADWLLLALEDVFTGIMPLELTLDQLPRKFQANGRMVSVAYRPMFSGEDVKALAVILTDTTAEVARVRLEAEHRETLAILDRVTRDPAGLTEFLAEAESLINCLRAGVGSVTTVMKRQLHTLKGNTGVFGLELLAAECHRVETRISEGECELKPAELVELFTRWEVIQGFARRLLKAYEPQLNIGEGELMAAMDDLRSGYPRESVITRMLSWRLEPTAVRLGRMAEQTQSIAARLGKGTVTVLTHDHGVRMEAIKWAEFWSSLIHVVRNAVDHGIESAEERIALGKPAEGCIELSTQQIRSELVIRVCDDGRGIDWERMARAAQNRGLPAETHDDLVEALFHDGVSTATQVTEISGRGVGMSAVRAICKQLGGQIQVTSERHRGTTLSFIFPASELSSSNALFNTGKDTIFDDRPQSFSHDYFN